MVACRGGLITPHHPVLTQHYINVGVVGDAVDVAFCDLVPLMHMMEDLGGMISSISSIS